SYWGLFIKPKANSVRLAIFFKFLVRPVSGQPGRFMSTRPSSHWRCSFEPTEKAPAIKGRGKLAERIEVEFGPFRPAASRRAECFLVALPPVLGSSAPNICSSKPRPHRPRHQNV